MSNKTPTTGTKEREAFDIEQSLRIDRIVAIMDDVRTMPDGDDKNTLLELGNKVKGRLEREIDR